MKTREQERMQQTWEMLSERYPISEPFERWGNEAKGEAPKYLNAVKRTAPRIHASGLGQALAFLLSRRKEPEEKACKDISTVTLKAFGLDGDDLLSQIREHEAEFIFAATDEAMQVCGWLARYLSGAGVKAEDNNE